MSLHSRACSQSERKVFLNKEVCKACWNSRTNEFCKGWPAFWDEPKSVWQCWHTRDRDDWRHPLAMEITEVPKDCLYSAEHAVCQQKS